jgi:hypothetical protein
LHITNRLVTYTPNEPFELAYKTLHPGLVSVTGPYDPDQFNLEEKTPLDFNDGAFLDACADSDAYRQTSFRGKRRRHAYQLAADYRSKPLYFYENWFDDSDKFLLSDLLDLLRAFCHGVRVTFKDRFLVWYQIDHEYWNKVQAKLKDIRKRIQQVVTDREDDIPPIPEFAYTTQTQYSGVGKAFFSANDWEVLAATYKREAENFVQTCIYMGYDYQPSQSLKFFGPEDLEDSEYPEDYEIAQPMSPSVRKLLEDSQK